MDNKELSKAVREELKKNGINRKDYSISVYYAGYEQSIKINVKNLSVDVKRIENILHNFESVQRDVRSYEILSGGNIFLFVQYDYDILRAAEAAKMEEAQHLYNKALDFYKKEHCGYYIQNDKNKKIVYFPTDGTVYMDDLTTGKESRRAILDVYGLSNMLVMLENKGQLN